LIAQLVEEDGVRERAYGPPPPMVDDLDDTVEVGLLYSADVHGNRPGPRVVVL
jgi:hypothetical protein